MRIANFFQMNDWSIRHFLIFIFSIQAAMWGVCGIPILGIPIPYIVPIISFFYLLYVPGILIIRCLKLHKLGNIETVLFTIGLSLASIMLVGFSANLIYPLFGITSPLSILPLTFDFTLFVVILCIISYIHDKEYSNPGHIDLSDFLTLPAVILFMVPCCAIIGSVLMNYYNFNLLMLFLIVYILLILLLIGFNKLIPSNLYPFAIWVIALALVYHTALISQYIWGWDINYELFLSKIVINNNIWDISIVSSINSMLSITILVPIFSILGNIDPVWVFKIYYPFIISFIALGLYKIYQMQSDDKIAFFSSFFFVTFFGFFNELFQLGRQAIAEVFLVLFLLVFLNSSIATWKKSVLMLIFGISIALSHYGLNFIFILLLFCSFILLNFLSSQTIIQWINYILSRLIFNEKIVQINEHDTKKFNNGIKLIIIAIFTIFTLIWYIYIGFNTNIMSIVNIGQKIGENIFTDFARSNSVESLNIVMSVATTNLHQFWKYLQIISQFFIGIGLLSLLFQVKKLKFKIQYLIFAFVCFIFLILCFIVPFLASALNTSRIYQISLIFLSPFLVIGFVFVFQIINKLKIPRLNFSMSSIFITLAIFLGVLCIFNTGFLFEIANDSPISIAFNNSISYPRFSESEIAGGTWLWEVKDDNSIVTNDFNKFFISGLNSRNYNYYDSTSSLVYPDQYEFDNLNQKLEIRKSTKVSKMARLGPFFNNNIYANGKICIEKIIRFPIPDPPYKVATISTKIQYPQKYTA